MTDLSSDASSLLQRENERDPDACEASSQSSYSALPSGQASGVLVPTAEPKSSDEFSVELVGPSASAALIDQNPSCYVQLYFVGTLMNQVP